MEHPAERFGFSGESGPAQSPEGMSVRRKAGQSGGGGARRALPRLPSAFSRASEGALRRRKGRGAAVVASRLVK